MKKMNSDKEDKAQKLFEKILLKHGIEKDAPAYCLMLSRPPMDDLVIRKKDSRINIGYNSFSLSSDGNIIDDIVLSFDYNAGRWIALEIENSDFENTEEDEESLAELIDIFQGQEWLEKGVLKNRGQLNSNFGNRSWSIPS
jgi:hypothetical protein